jgi:endonuclease/exonuclease/phosphatase family metal-dependent hydrolase
MKKIKKILKWTAGAILLFLVYVLTCLVHGTATDYQPEEKITLKIAPNSPLNIIKTANLTFLNWNIGYAGLGGKSNFFYDDGNPFFFSNRKMIRSPRKFVEENISGISNFITKNKADFILLQEVDKNSKRSYYINQHQKYSKQLPNYSSSFATNFLVERVLIPVCEPWHVMGQMESGLSTYSKYTAQNATRYQFPGSYGWPDYIFHLDRCFSAQRYQTIHPEGKELIVINTHNSAYDGGTLKQQEMDYFKSFVLKEYEQGNYVIVGGDWNQTPPNVPFDSPGKAIGVPTDSSYYPANILPNFMPEGWQWAFDDKVPTNRAMANILNYGKTAVSLVDYYLVSPNVKVIKVAGQNLKFENSDHNPVLMEVILEGLIEFKTDSLIVDSLSI